MDGTITAGDVATVTIRDRPYNYTVLATDTTATVRDELVAIKMCIRDRRYPAERDALPGLLWGGF